MQNQKGSIAIFARLSTYLLPYWPPFLLILLLVFVDIGFNMCIALVQTIMIDNIQLANVQELMLFIRVSSAVTLSVIILLYIQYYLRLYFQQMMTRDISLHVFDKVNRLPFVKAKSVHSGDWITRITEDANQSSGVTGQVMFNLVSNVCLCLVSFFFLVVIDFWLAVLALAAAPIPLIVGRIFDRRLRKLSSDIQSRGAGIRGLLQEAFLGLPTIKAFGMEEGLLHKFSSGRKEQNELIVRRTVLGTWMGQSISLTNGAVMIVAGFFISTAAIRGSLSLGSVLAFLFLMERIQGPFSSFSQMLGSMQQGMASALRVFEVLDASGQGKQTAAETDPSAISGANVSEGLAVDCSEISFSVTEEDGSKRIILDRINLTLRPGEIVGVVGSSGSGKSTLARLLCGLLEPDTGDIRIFGKTPGIDGEHIRNQIAYVPQSPQLFSGTIYENIACGAQDPSEGQVKAAAQLAHASEFIERMKEQYETYIGEKGQSLSGGQQQRLAIARAFVRDAPLFILDEPTSGLDADSEELVTQSLMKFLPGRTAVIITHRLSNLQAADRIVVLEAGRIAEQGTLEELISRKGLFCNLFQMQQTSSN